MLICTTRFYLGFYNVEHMDQLVAMEHALWLNTHTSSNLHYNHVYTSARAPISRAATRQFYRAMAPLHQERVNLLVQFLQNDCIPLNWKYEIVTNLPRLVSMEDPDFYQ